MIIILDSVWKPSKQWLQKILETHAKHLLNVFVIIYYEVAFG